MYKANRDETIDEFLKRTGYLSFSDIQEAVKKRILMLMSTNH